MGDQAPDEELIEKDPRAGVEVHGDAAFTEPAERRLHPALRKVSDPVLSLETFDLLNVICEGDLPCRDILSWFLARDPDRSSALLRLASALTELIDAGLVTWKRLGDFGAPTAVQGDAQAFRELLVEAAGQPETWVLGETTIKATDAGLKEVFEGKYDVYLPELRAKFGWE